MNEGSQTLKGSVGSTSDGKKRRLQEPRNFRTWPKPGFALSAAFGSKRARAAKS